MVRLNPVPILLINEGTSVRQVVQRSEYSTIVAIWDGRKLLHHWLFLAV